MHWSIRRELLIFSIVVIVACAKGNDNSDLIFRDCTNSENPIACRGVSFISRALNQVISNHDDTLKILPGLEIVQNENVNKISGGNERVRSMSEQQNETILTKVAKYLQTHDLKIKFSDMVGKTDLQEVVNSVLSNDDPAVEEARKKDKGGGGALMMMGLMMGKMMAAMGLAGVGALAMKAMGVSMAALMLAGIVGLKKLTEGSGDGGHQVHYVSAGGGDHHRRKRDADSESRSTGNVVAPLPYRGQSYEMPS